MLAGLLGLTTGAVVAVLVRERGEPFPTNVILGFAFVFTLAGGCAKQQWAEDVLEFFYNVLPWG